MRFREKLIICAAAVVIFARPATAREIVVNAVGDIMLSGSGATTCKRLGYDYPFAATASELKKGDITIGNLESPIARRGREFTNKKFRYRSAPQAAAALKNAGFSIVTLANNHMMDFGATAMEETRQHLDRAGIGSTGAGASLAAARRGAIITVRGMKVAFLAYSFTLPDDFYATVARAGTAPGFDRYYRQDIAEARKVADYVLVSFHWGTESTAIPKPYQVTAAHRAIDAGADVVIGHHPHVLQGVERYKNGVIFYSLGNFAFGTTSRSSDRSVIARITMENGVKGVELLPLNVLNRDVHYQPQLLSGKKGKEVIDHLAKISRKWKTTVTANGGHYLVEMGSAERLARKF
ncbi:MAG TPA: CapA family protein [Geobacteraceae bacterium]|nr:CapA family protein [Geobacteraceae bacterium]